MTLLRTRFLPLRLLLLAALHIPIVFAGFFAPCDPEEQHRWDAYSPPSLRATSGPIRFLVNGPPYRIAGLLPSRIHLFGADPPGMVFLLGSDRFGRDQLSRILYGGQLSLAAGFASTMLALLVGTAVGVMAGFYGGWVDDVCMRAVDLMVALPWLYLLLAVRAFLPLALSPFTVLMVVTLILGAIGWARPARLVRGVVLSAREQEFVEASVSFGASSPFVLRHHILPQTYGIVLTQATVLVPRFVLAEVTLSFLGLGVSEPAASWGSLLATLQQYAAVRAYWWLTLPIAVLVLFVGAYSALANALAERLRLTH